MLREYLTNTLQRLSDGGTRQVPYPEVMEAVRADMGGLLNELYKEGAISVHSTVNGVKIITWGGDGYAAGHKV